MQIKEGNDTYPAISLKSIQSQLWVTLIKPVSKLKEPEITWDGDYKNNGSRERIPRKWKILKQNTMDFYEKPKLTSGPLGGRVRGTGKDEGRLDLTWKSGGPRPSHRPATSCPFEILSRSMSPLFVLKFWSPFVKLVVVLELDKG